MDASARPAESILTREVAPGHVATPRADLMNEPPGPGSVRVLDDPDPLFAELVAAVRASLPAMRPDATGLPPGLTVVVGRPGRHGLTDGSQRPGTVVWVGEPLPRRSVTSPNRLTRLARTATTLGLGRSSALSHTVGPIMRSLPLPDMLDAWRVAAMTTRLLVANLEEVRDAYRGGARIVVTSRDRMVRLADEGIETIVVPFGYHPLHAGQLTAGGVRDQPMAAIGSVARHTRRARILKRLAASAGRDLLICDGMWGAQRAELLRRTRVIVDVHRVPGNFVGLRLLLGLAAGAAVVTEPMTDPHPFVPGVHYVEAPAPDLVDVARALAADDSRRRAIIAAGQYLIATDLTMERSVARILAAAGAVRDMPG